MAKAPQLTIAELNRALLARQGLLGDRSERTATNAVSRLGELQAQEPRPPFAALTSRVEGFEGTDLRAALDSRQLIRASWIRGTLHIVTAEDYLAYRLALQPVMERAFAGILVNRRTWFDAGPVLETARAVFEGGPISFAGLRRVLEAEFPGIDPQLLGYAARMGLPLVMVPDPEAEFGFRTGAAFALAEDWLGRPPSGEAETEALAWRYLAAYGPATVADFQTYSGLTAAKAVFDGMAEDLVAFQGPKRRIYYDLPSAPRPAPDAYAPPRLLAEWDSAVMAHADRARVVADHHRGVFRSPNGRLPAVFLVNGFAAGTWTFADEAVSLSPFEELSRWDRDALAEEAERMGRLLGGRGEVRFAG